MNLLNLLSDIAAQAGYTISSGTGQDATNKARAIRRFTAIHTDIISRYGGKWDSNYKEGWLALVPLYQDGMSTFTINSRVVTGTSTLYTSTMKGYKIKGPDGAWYRVASVSSSTNLYLSQPYQGTTSTITTNIWKDEYRLHPEVFSVAGFVDYMLNGAMQETWPRNMKDSYPNPSSVDIPDVYTIVGRDGAVVSYSTGTVSASVNTTTWTGVNTLWQANLEPGMQFVVGAYTYTIRRINSDTELETYQLAVIAASGATYSALGKNALVVRFKQPTSQRIVSYWYWAKDFPLMNDNDEDWICEMFSKVLIDGILKYDYMDKADVIRVDRATMAYEDSIKNMKVAMDSAFTGPRALGYYFPDNARD